VSFVRISQPWLNQAAKRWARWRLATGCAFTTIAAGALALSRFSRFLTEVSSDADESAIDRPLLESYLAWLAGSGLASNTRLQSVVFLRSFLEENRRFLWLADVPSRAAIYHDDMPRPGRPTPRFVTETVMAQIESESNLAELEPTTRHLVSSPRPGCVPETPALLPSTRSCPTASGGRACAFTTPRCDSNSWSP
jgi:site-specific recombinase XerD